MTQVVGATATAGVLGASRAGAQTNSALTVLRVGCIQSDGPTAAIYASKAGLFRDAGLDVQIMVQPRMDVIPPVLAGIYDVALISITGVLLAHQSGIPVVLVAPAGTYDSKEPYAGAITLLDGPIRSGKDLEGAVLGVSSLNDIGQDAFCAWVAKDGGDPRTLRFVEILLSSAAAAVEQRRVVASETAAPAMNAALDTGKFRFINMCSAIAPTFTLSTWFTTKDFAAKNAGTLRTFARVVAAAGVYANSHHAETAAMMSEFTGIPVEQYLRMPRALQGRKLSPALFQPAITAAAKYGSLKSAFRAEELLDANIIP